MPSRSLKGLVDIDTEYNTIEVHDLVGKAWGKC